MVFGDENKSISEKEIQLKDVMNEKMLLDRKEYRRLGADVENMSEKIDTIPRFPSSGFTPKDWIYYGLHLDDYKDAKTFLGVRECQYPTLYRLDNKIRDDVLFLNTNIDRVFEGRARIINETNRTPIQGMLRFENFPPIHQVRYYNYESLDFWIRSSVGNRSFRYGGKSVNERELSSWFFNGCSKAMSLALNECWLDQSYDMGLVDFIYLTRFDLILGNFYCKKSNESKWTRVALLEFLRTR